MGSNTLLAIGMVAMFLLICIPMVVSECKEARLVSRARKILHKDVQEIIKDLRRDNFRPCGRKHFQEEIKKRLKAKGFQDEKLIDCYLDNN